MMIPRRSLLLAAAPPPAPKWMVRPEAGRVVASAGRGIVMSFHHDHARFDKPFLYPLMTPAGRVISRGFPMAPRPGESNDHAWHRGLFHGHGLVNGHDFWREQGREKTSTFALEGTPVARVESGEAVVGGRFRMVVPDGRSIGTVAQEYRLALAGGALRVSFELRILADGGQSLKLGDTDDGGFGIRLADEFRQDKGAVLRNSEGLETTEKIWGQPARWVHYATKEAGAVMMDHPANLRHPGRWHARGYALCSANPFALRSFTKDKSADGSYEIPAGGQLRLRYAVLLHDGALSAETIEAAYRDFAKT